MKEINVLHVLKDSIPYIAGSTIRSKHILEDQVPYMQVLAYTDYKFESKSKRDAIWGVLYYRGYSKKLKRYNSFIQKLRKGLYKLRININFLFPLLEYPLYYHTKKDLKKIIEKERINLIHQHSEYQVGKFTQKIAEKLDIPYVYEARAFLEDGLMVEAHKWRLKGKRMQDFVYNSIRNRETEIFKKADKIVVLCPPMVDELVERGIDENKITIVPNAVSRENRSCKKVMDKNSLVISYIGTMEEHEGIHILLKSIFEISRVYPNIKVFLVGRVESEYKKELDFLIKELKLENNVRFFGVVDHDKIDTIYESSDFIVIPRLNRRVCRMISPIKPLEAMSYEKLVITSNLPAMRYHIEHFRTGVLVAPEHEYDISNKILYLINNPEEKEQIEYNARCHVLKNFNWEENIKKYVKIYEELL